MKHLFFSLVLLGISGLFNSCSKTSDSPEIKNFIKNISEHAMGLTFDSNGNMFVATYEEQAPKKILKISHDGNISTFLSLECFAIQNIVADRKDSLYVSVIINNGDGGAKILKITQEARISTFSEGFTQPVGVTFDAEDNLYVVDAMAKKVYKISPSKEKSVYIDLGNADVVPNNYYHSIDFEDDYKNLYIAGLYNGGKGNILKYPINADGNPQNPEVISDRFSKHLVVHKNIVYATVENKALLIINADGSQQLVQDPLLTDGGYLSFGQKEFGENTLYINTGKNIVEMNFSNP